MKRQLIKQKIQQNQKKTVEQLKKPAIQNCQKQQKTQINNIKNKKAYKTRQRFFKIFNSKDLSDST